MIKNGYSLKPTIRIFETDESEDPYDDSHDPSYERANMLRWLSNKYGLQ